MKALELKRFCFLGLNFQVMVQVEAKLENVYGKDRCMRLTMFVLCLISRHADRVYCGHSFRYKFRTLVTWHIMYSTSCKWTACPSHFMPAL